VTETAKHSLDIRPASPDIWPQLAELFAAGGDPRWCWCQYWRKPGSSWSNADVEVNRADLERLIGEDPAPGLVALVDGRAVGWVGLGPREDFPRLARSRTLPTLPGERVWSVNCFVVARGHRGRGVARRLLEAAVDYAGQHGARILEGFPVETGGSRMPSAGAYTGTRSMFESAGFVIAGPTTSKAGGGRPRVVMRRALDRSISEQARVGG
jgi:GNAT superfamily N-acetyltransferase